MADVLIPESQTTLITYAEQGPRGVSGSKGDKGDATTVGISSDPDNRLAAGSDGGLYVAPPQLASSQW